MISILNSKKSQAAKNIFVGIVFLLSFAFLSILGVLISTEIITTWQGLSVYDASVMGTSVTYFIGALKIFDYLTVLFMAIFIVGIAITSYRLASAPIFFIVTFIMAALYGFVSYVLNYIFIQYISESSFSSIIYLFPNTILICTNLHWVALANIVVGSIALYAKAPKGQFLK